jgi:hypothetical protein
MPVRKIPRRGARKNISKFFSVKMNKRLWSESLAEEDYKYLLDFDSKVESFEEQPFRIRYVLDGKTRYYTPDMLVLTKDGRRLVVEVKPKSKVSTPRNDLLFRIVAPLCETEAHKFVVITVEKIREQPRLNNIKALWKYARTRLHPQHQIYCRELFLTREKVTLGEAFEFFESKGVGKHVVYALLFWGALSFEVTKPLSIQSSIGCPQRAAKAAGKVA